MGSVTFWGPLDTSFLFAQIVGAWWPQKTSVFGPQNLALCEVLGSKCDKNKSRETFRKVLSNLFLRDNCRLSQRFLNNGKECTPSCSYKIGVSNRGIWKCPLSLMNGTCELQKWAFRAFKSRSLMGRDVYPLRLTGEFHSMKEIAPSRFLPL